MDAEEVLRIRTFKRFLISKAGFVGLLASTLFCVIYFNIAHISPKNYIKDVQSMQCQLPNHFDGIGFQVFGVAPGGEHSYIYTRFRFVEYLLYKKSGVYTNTYPGDPYHQLIANVTRERLKESSCPVLVFPGASEAADSVRFLAKLVQDHERAGRTKAEKLDRTELHYTWTTMDFLRHSTLASWEGLKRYIDSVHFIGSQMNMIYPEVKIAYMCHGIGGGMCYWIGNFYSANVSLMILESTPSELAERYTKQVPEWWAENMNSYNKTSPTGIMVFQGGYDDRNTDPSWFKWRHSTIPVWTIDGVPDNGLSMKEMHTCEPYLNFIAKLLIEHKINKELGRRRTGKSITNSYYREWQNEKRRHLPDNWKNDKQDDVTKVQIGNMYNFVVNRSHWLDVDVQRNTSLVLHITGSCLTSATIIRRRKFIKRKRRLFNSTLFEFGIYQVKPFEDVRVFLESGSECEVTIATSPWWLDFTQRFYYAMVVDPHYFWIGVQITFVFLATLESDKRSYRWEYQIYAYTWFILAALYHTFSTFGVPCPGMIFGAGVSITVHFVCSTFHEYVFVRQARRSLDSFVRKFQHVLVPLILSFCFCHFSSAVSAILTILMYTWSIRPMLLPAAILGHIPVFYRILYQPMKWHHDEPYLELLRQYATTRKCYVGTAILAAIAYSYINPKLARTYFRLIAYALFICQLSLSHWPLDLHYGIGIVILALNHSCAQRLPKQILGVEKVDLENLEKAYLGQDDQND